MSLFPMLRLRTLNLVSTFFVVVSSSFEFVTRLQRELYVCVFAKAVFKTFIRLYGNQIRHHLDDYISKSIRAALNTQRVHISRHPIR